MQGDIATKTENRTFLTNVGFSLQEKLADFIGLFYPCFCVGCGTPLRRGETDLCLTCLMNLPAIPTETMRTGALKEHVRGLVEIESATSFLAYGKEGIVQHILQEIKYKGNKELGRRLGRMFGAKLQGACLDGVDALLPVPLHPNKQKLRGYNQSEWIAKGMSEALGIPVWTDVLERKVENTTQTKKGAFERWENVKGIFGVTDATRLNGKHVVVVDDVLTTGATIEACILPMAEAENVKVSIATLAVVY